MLDINDRRGFFVLSTLFEGSLVFVAAAIVLIFPLGPRTQPPPILTWPALATQVGEGLLATGPLYGLFLLSSAVNWAPFQQIRRLLLELLGPVLPRCRWFELVFVACLAGFCEEILFRGVLQPRLGLVGSNLAFGLAHSITPLYVILAGIMGAYLGVVSEQAGLLAAIVAHSAYDFLAFQAVARLQAAAVARKAADATNPDSATLDP